MNLSDVGVIGGLLFGAIGTVGAVGTLLQELRYRREKFDGSAPEITLSGSWAVEGCLDITISLRNRVDTKLELLRVQAAKPASLLLGDYKRTAPNKVELMDATERVINVQKILHASGTVSAMFGRTYARDDAQLRYRTNITQSTPDGVMLIKLVIEQQVGGHLQRQTWRLKRRIAEVKARARH